MRFCFIWISPLFAFIIPQLVQPRRARLVHYSGHEDTGGPLTDREFDERLRTNIREQGLEIEVRLARAGESFS